MFLFFLNLKSSTNIKDSCPLQVSDEKEGWREGTILATKVGVEDRCVKAPSIRMGTDGHGWTVWAQFWTF